jgi:RNA-binding protein
MALTIEQKKHYRSLAHPLKPVVTVAGKGLSETVLQEINRALDDHELIKVKIKVGDRDLKQEVITELCTATKCEVVQAIGHIAVLLRKSPKPNPRLSNLLRQAGHSN